MEKSSLATKVRKNYSKIPKPIREDIEDVAHQTYTKAKSTILEKTIKHLTAFKNKNN